MKREIHEEAQAELFVALEYYSAISPELGGRFYDEIERLLREVCEHPQRFRKYDPPARRHLGRDFPYAVIYIEQPDHVWIVAIMPLRRDPDYWKHRLA